MLDLKKAQDALQGPMLLPLRRIDLNSVPKFPASKKENLTPYLGQMFTSNADLMHKMVKTLNIPTETLFGLKEVIQMILKWSIDPPEETPNVSNSIIQLKDIQMTFTNPTKFKL